SDDPLATSYAVDLQDLDGPQLILPDLAVGRLVETPEEIISAIDGYLAQDGFLNVSPPFGDDHRVLVTGYDFLLDCANRICTRWRNYYPEPSVNCDLVSPTWDLPTVEERREALRNHLADGYSVMSLNGHATHYEEGVPGQGIQDIQGLNAVDIYGPNACGTPSQGALDLYGSIAYSTGCHGGLPVPGSCAGDDDHSLDLPQTFLSRGVPAYVANTGYGWGLFHGIGYSEEMVNLLTQELTAGGVAIGDAVRRSKERYYMESPRYDVYDVKTSLQWTLFGFPTYEIRTGIAAKAADRELPAGERRNRPAVERLGAVSVERRLSRGGDAVDLPPYLTRIELSFDLQAEGIYTKYDTTGEIVETEGCPDPEGCYYALNGLVERSTGECDLPIQPYLVYDSRLSGTSQHGVLWTGGAYEEETGWVPLFAKLITNGSPDPDLGSTPRTIRIRPRNPRLRNSLGEDPPDCRPADDELNSVVLTTGEAVMDDNLEYSIEHLFREVDIEIFYYNNTSDPTANCDRTGPEFGTGPYHQFLGTTVQWAVEMYEAETEVWRVVVVYDDGTLDAQGRHLWIPVELEDDGTGVWQGSVPTPSFEHFTYFLQAVDHHGNVSWVLYVPEEEPSSGASLDLPLPVEVDAFLFADDFETGDCSRWSGCSR
ncbi:MAG: hypothetical protein GY856_30195, partial [bacterium]|nr:hypothetical protein [bacterium]